MRSLLPVILVLLVVTFARAANEVFFSQCECSTKSFSVVGATDNLTSFSAPIDSPLFGCPAIANHGLPATNGIIFSGGASSTAALFTSTADVSLVNGASDLTPFYAVAELKISSVTANKAFSLLLVTTTEDTNNPLLEIIVNILVTPTGRYIFRCRAVNRGFNTDNVQSGVLDSSASLSIVGGYFGTTNGAGVCLYVDGALIGCQIAGGAGGSGTASGTLSISFLTSLEVGSALSGIVSYFQLVKTATALADKDALESLANGIIANRAANPVQFVPALLSLSPVALTIDGDRAKSINLGEFVSNTNSFPLTFALTGLELASVSKNAFDGIVTIIPMANTCGVDVFDFTYGLSTAGVSGAQYTCLTPPIAGTLKVIFVPEVVDNCIDNESVTNKNTIILAICIVGVFILALAVFMTHRITKSRMNLKKEETSLITQARF